MMSWLGNVLICFGAWHIAKKRWWAFLFSLAGETLWVVFAVSRHMWSLGFICTVFAGLALRNLCVWRKEVEHDI